MPLAESKATDDGRRAGLPRGTKLLLIGLALVLVIGSAGFLYTAIAKQRTINNAHATATVQAKLAGTHAAATATYQAITTVIAAQTQATATAIPATATATALLNIYIQATTRGRPALNDPLVDNSKGYGWDTSSFTGFPCEFTGGAYHVKAQTQGFFSLCLARGTDYSNFAFQVQTTIIAGDSGGIVFRADGANNRYYLFEILSNGTYGLTLYDGIASHTRTLDHGSSSAINTDLNEPNLITVVAQGSSIDLFVNQQYVTGRSDSTYSHGQIGVMAGDHYGNSTEVVYSNATVWTL